MLAVGLAGPYLLLEGAIIVGVDWMGQRDVSPLAFALFAPFTTVALLRGAASELVLVAREQLVEELADAMLVVDARGRVLDANARARTLFGEDATMRGQPLATAAATSPAVAALLAATGDALRGGEPGTRQVALGGRQFDVRISEIRDGRGAAVRARAALLHDVTALHEANAALRSARDDLEARVRARTAEALERERERQALARQVQHLQRLESIGRLAGGIAHDFNNYLAAIIGNTSLVRDALPAGSPDRDDLDVALHAARSASGLTRQLLAIGRREPTGVGPTDVEQALRRVGSLVGPLLGARITHATHIAPGSGQAAIDPGALEQVLMNLAINARDAMPDGGALTLACEPVRLEGTTAEARAVATGPYVRVTVADTGHGMSDEVRARVFEPFFTTKPEGAGSGLGLAMVFSLVRAVGGHVEVESAPGAGTRVLLYLPRAARVTPVPSVTARLLPDESPAAG